MINALRQPSLPTSAVYTIVYTFSQIWNDAMHISRVLYSIIRWSRRLFGNNFMRLSENKTRNYSNNKQHYYLLCIYYYTLHSYLFFFFSSYKKYIYDMLSLYTSLNFSLVILFYII
ncbi:hypothetical protein AAHE18_03G019300 [Arachis hypogaea]